MFGYLRIHQCAEAKGLTLLSVLHFWCNQLFYFIIGMKPVLGNDLSDYCCMVNKNEPTGIYCLDGDFFVKSDETKAIFNGMMCSGLSPGSHDGWVTFNDFKDSGGTLTDNSGPDRFLANIEIKSEANEHNRHESPVDGNDTNYNKDDNGTHEGNSKNDTESGEDDQPEKSDEKTNILTNGDEFSGDLSSNSTVVVERLLIKESNCLKGDSSLNSLISKLDNGYIDSSYILISSPTFEDCGKCYSISSEQSTVLTGLVILWDESRPITLFNLDKDVATYDLLSVDEKCIYSIALRANPINITMSCLMLLNILIVMM